MSADVWAAEEHATAVAEGRGCWHCWGIAQGIHAKRKGSALAAGQSFLVIEGQIHTVIHHWVEVEASDGRKRWLIVTRPVQEGNQA